MAKKNKMGTIYPKRIQETIHGVQDENVQIGYAPKKIQRKEGEVWKDKNGKQWEMKDGIVQSIPKFQDVRVPLFCPKCNKVMGRHQKDVEVYYKFNFCFDCLIERDIEMVREGTMPEYAKNYVKSKQLGYFNEMKESIEEYLDSIEGKDHLEFLNEDGKFENWTGDLSKVRDFWIKELESVNKEIEKVMED